MPQVGGGAWYPDCERIGPDAELDHLVLQNGAKPGAPMCRYQFQGCVMHGQAVGHALEAGNGNADQQPHDGEDQDKLEEGDAASHGATVGAPSR
jgi:hypothetical protein